MEDNNILGDEALMSQDEISFKEIIKFIWSEKITLSYFVLFFAIVSVIYSLSLNDIYSSEVTFSSTEQNEALNTQGSGLAALAGISNTSQGNKRDLGIKIIKSLQFFEDFNNKYNVLPELMAIKSWDKATDTIRYDESTYDESKDEWTDGSIPSIQESHKEFIRHITINQDSNTGFITMSVNHYSPHVAKKWADLILEEINLKVKNQEIKKAERSIEFLENEIKDTNNNKLIEDLYSLVLKEMETIMLANSSPEYVFTTIDPAYSPERKSAPSRSLICIFGTILGAIIGFLVIFISNIVKN